MFVCIDAESMEEEAEFNWEEYLEETGANAAPHTTFKHVSMISTSLFNPVPVVIL